MFYATCAGALLMLLQLSLGKSTYDEAMAHDALAYAGAAYCPAERVATWSTLNALCQDKTTGFEVYATVKATAPKAKLDKDYFGYMGVDHYREWVVAAFKGTNGSVADFATDLQGGYFASDCTINGTDLGKVHQGFCDYFDYLNQAGFSDALAALAAAHPTYPVVLTGHSLGAAVAVVAATYLGQSTHALATTVYTYGQPRVGDFSFSQLFSESVQDAWRVVHRKDAIAHEPFCCGLLGACRPLPTCPYHTENEAWYRHKSMHNGSFEVCADAEDTSCANWVDLSIDDHLIYFDESVGSYCCENEAQP